MINDSQSFFQILLADVSHRPIFDVFLSKIFLNELLPFIKKAELVNCAEHSTSYHAIKDLTKLLGTLQNSPVDTGGKLNVHETFRRDPGRLRPSYVRSVYVLCPKGNVK